MENSGASPVTLNCHWTHFLTKVREKSPSKNEALVGMNRETVFVFVLFVHKLFINSSNRSQSQSAIVIVRPYSTSEGRLAFIGTNKSRIIVHLVLVGY